MQKHISLFLSAVLLLTGCSAKLVQNEPKPADNTVYSRDSAGIRLEDDFYGYINFDLLYGTDIPADMFEAGTLRMVQKNVDDVISDEIISIGKNDTHYPDGSDEKRIHDIYRQYLDTETREQVGLAPLEKALNAIENARTANDFVHACGMIHTEYGVPVLPAVGVKQDNYDSSKNMPYIGQMQLYYTADELQNGRDSAENLQQQMAEILRLLGHDKPDSLACDIVTMLLDIAASTADVSQMSVEDMYNIRKPDELNPLVKEYLASAGMGSGNICVLDIAQLEKIGTLLTDDNMEIWKSLAECMLVYAYKDVLPSSYSEAFEQVSFQTDEEKAVQIVKTLLVDEIGRIYAQKYGDEKTFAAVGDMTSDIISAYRKCIESSELLTENDRRECLAKIDNISVNIGCPDVNAHKDVQLSGNLLGSVIHIKSDTVLEMLSSADKAPDADEWGMPAYAVNAYYDAQKNSITVPMGLFIAPVFNVNADHYTNLGGLGSIIAHEIGHAFDADGILYDEYGNYRPDRISPKHTELLSDEVSAYFGSMQIMDTFYIDGEQTQTENAADLGGMQVIVSMTDDKEELRRIFESYANLWATLSYDTNASEQIADDVHSPAEIRVNGVLSSVDKFYEVYDISDGDEMFVPYDKRVRVW